MRVASCCTLLLLATASFASPTLAQDCCGSLKSFLRSATEDPGRCPSPLPKYENEYTITCHDDSGATTSSGLAMVWATGDCYSGVICSDPGRCLPSIDPPTITTTSSEHVWVGKGINRVWEQSLCFFDCKPDDPTVVKKFCPCAQCPSEEPAEDDLNTINDDGGTSPILIDLEGDGFLLTGAEAGVAFDMDGDGHSERISWTAATADEAFLALDRDRNGRIDSGLELFGNHTEQPATDHPNGFLALAVFDEPGLGGNGDGRITAEDAVFTELRLWTDANHDGWSDPEELRSLGEVGLQDIGLDYRLLGRRDRWGNGFRYMAHSWVERQVRQVYDVFFQLAKSGG